MKGRHGRPVSDPCRAIQRRGGGSNGCIAATRATLAPKPGEQAERDEELAVLSKAIREDLTSRQREVLVAIALNDVSIDVLALQLDSNRNAIYKNLFDARRKLRASLAVAGYPLTEEEALS